MRGGDVPRSGTGAVRALGRGRVVNLSLGIPFPRTSVEHGTARHRLAGEGERESMTAALRTAGRMASRLDPGPIEWTWRPAEVKWRAAAAERDDPLPRRHQGLSRGRVGLDQVTLEIERGDFVVISGPSGAGKSTLLRAVTLPCCPTRARWRWKGRRAPAPPARHPAHPPPARHHLPRLPPAPRSQHLRERDLPLRVLGNHDSRSASARCGRSTE